MKNEFYNYLKNLSNDELIELIYKPHTKIQTFECLSRRRIAIRFSYDGECYSGMALQRDKNTVASNILNALHMTGISDTLVVCGRTDAGVSAINMVAHMDVISRLPCPNNTFNITEDDLKEYRYDLILNNYLPHNIQITGWAPVSDDFSARFSCVQRQYRYYFPKEGLNIALMNDAADRILKLENFYELSKHSDKNARYNRRLDGCKVVDDGDIFYLDVRARAFLHNMVRKIVWVIMKAGRGEGYSLERVGLADAYPLVFTGAVFQPNLNFIGNHRNLDTFKQQYIHDDIKAKISNLRMRHFASDSLD